MRQESPEGGPSVKKLPETEGVKNPEPLEIEIPDNAAEWRADVEKWKGRMQSVAGRIGQGFSFLKERVQDPSKISEDMSAIGDRVSSGINAAREKFSQTLEGGKQKVTNGLNTLSTKAKILGYSITAPTADRIVRLLNTPEIRDEARRAHEARREVQSERAEIKSLERQLELHRMVLEDADKRAHEGVDRGQKLKQQVSHARQRLDELKQAA